MTTDLGTPAAESRSIAGQIAGGHVVRKDWRLPVDVAGDGFRVGIDEQLMGVEAQALLRLPRAFHAIAVTLPRLDVADEPVPNESGALAQRDAVDLIAVFIEEADRDAGGVLRK